MFVDRHLPATVRLCENKENIMAQTSQIALILLGNKALSKLCLFFLNYLTKRSLIGIEYFIINKLASLEATLVRNSAHLLTDGGEV